MNKKKSEHIRRDFSLLTAVLIFIWWFNNFTVKVDREIIYDSRINDEVRIVQITDLHGASFGKDNKKLIEKIEAQKPDFVVATGDMYTNQKRNNGYDTAVNLLRQLAGKYTVYYVNGEHDCGDSEFYNELEYSGVKVLNYRDELITVGDTVLHIYGINNVYYSDTFDLNNEFDADNKNFSLLLAHIPNFEKFKSFGIDLSLCGDTHGGRFRLPFVGAVYDTKSFFPELNGKYIKGKYTSDNSNLYISSGLGSYPAPVRFFNRPEISLIILRQK